MDLDLSIDETYYHNTQAFNNNLKINDNLILYVNIRSMNANLCKLECLLESLVLSKPVPTYS